MSLLQTTLELWPHEAYELLHTKGISSKKLRRLFNEVLFPWDESYDKERMLFSLQIQERPLFIVKARNRKEIEAALNLMFEHQLTMRIVGGRHSTLLAAPDFFLDISRFQHMHLDEKAALLTVGGGATQGAVNDFLFAKDPHYHFHGARPRHPFSHIFPGGTAATVGVAGITSAGGIGTLRRSLGLTIDTVTSFTIAVPPKSPNEKARTLIASSKEHPDLFWALRGGGAFNFGVVIEITYRVTKINRVLLYTVDWKQPSQDIVALWLRTAPKRPCNYNEDLSLSVNQGKFTLALTGLYLLNNDENEKEARRCIATELAPLEGSLTIQPCQPYAHIYRKFVQERIYHSFSRARTFLALQAEIDLELLWKFMEQAQRLHGNSYIGFQLMGGAIREVTPSATAFYPREASFFVDIFSFWDNVKYSEENEAWNKNFYGAFYSTLGPYIYLGFPEKLGDYYGSNRTRLFDIKKRYDPLHLLCGTLE